MTSLLLAALCLLSHLLVAEPTCQSGYSVSPGQPTCLSGILASAVGYCKCLQICTELSQKLLQPDTYAAVRLSLSSTVWTAVNDQLTERGSSPTGWQVVPNWSGSVFNATSLWASGQPGGTSIEDCVNHSAITGKLHDSGCDANAACMCEHPIDNQRPVQQHFDLFASAAVVDFTQGAVGCNSELLNSPVQLHCAAACRAMLGCVGFYFNRLRSECVLLQYFDAAVQLSYGSSAEQLAWVKSIAHL